MSIYITNITKATLQKFKDKNLINIYLPPRLKIHTQTKKLKNFKPQNKDWFKKQNLLFKKGRLTHLADLNNPLKWASGGGLLIISDSRNNEYAICVKRSATSVVNPGKLTLCSGHSDNIQEIKTPSLLIREALEEIIFYTKDDRLIIPELNKKYPLDIKKMITTAAEKINLPTLKYKRINFEILTNLNNSIVSVFDNSGKLLSKTTSIFCWDYKIAAINILWIIKTNLKLEKVTPFDTEFIIKNKTIIPLKRDLILIKLDRAKSKQFEGIQINSWKNIFKRKKINTSMTKHLKTSFLVYLNR